jgi:putative nucleotidyltransferase with HDIG domain
VNREQAWAILTEFVQSESLRKHCLAVEAAMRGYARKYGEDEEKWAVVGLLHDFDFEIHPTADKHPAAGAPLLRERGVPEDIIYAIQTHAEYLDLPRNTKLEVTLHAVDELSGFLLAVALVRPGRTLEGVEASSIRKKMKDKAFARAVSREDITQGAAELGEPFDEHVVFVARSLQAAPELGLGQASG